MFKEGFQLDGKTLHDRSSLALYLKNNFKKSINFIKDDSLYLFLQKELPEVYDKVVDLGKDFEHIENILTLIIYLLDNSLGINTPNHNFLTNHDIADVMKRTYPNVNADIKVLFHDKVLAHIFWNEYNKNFDSKFKRNYTFMLHVYENRMHEFTYYYYLFLHLAKNETVRFTLDGLKMKSLSEITVHLSQNIDRAQTILEEIYRNPFILALMALQSGIDTVAASINKKQSLDILKLLSTYAQVDLTPIIRKKMAYWLLSNYANYTYETEEAKILYNDYVKVTRNLTLSTLSDYIAIYDDISLLYQRFILLFNHNKLITFREGITTGEEYYLNYRYNDDYVCKKFLTDNGLYDESIHTNIHRDTVEREVLVDALEEEKKEIFKFRDEVLLLTEKLDFNKRFLRQRLFVAVMYLLLVFVSMVGGLLLGVKSTNDLTQLVKYGVFGLGGLSLFLLIISIAKYSKKINDADLVELAMENSLHSIEAINKEAQLILNPNNKTFKESTLNNTLVYSKNRKRDLAKIKKIATKKQTVSSGLLILATSMSIIPIIEFGLTAVLRLFNIIPFAVYVNGIEFNVITIALFAIEFVLLIIFRKKRFAYYLIYLYMILLGVLGYIFIS